MKISLKAGGTIAPCRAVKRSGADGMIQAAVQGEKFSGVSPEGQKGPPGVLGSDTAVVYESGDYGFYYGTGENKVLVTSGASFSAAVDLMTDSSGKFILATTGNWVGARADVAATAADQKIPVIVLGDSGYYLP